MRHIQRSHTQHAGSSRTVIATGAHFARTRLELLDVEPLCDEDALTPGFYVAVCGLNTSRSGRPWRGCGVLRSIDGGESFTRMVAMVPRSSPIGYAVRCGEGSLEVQMFNDYPLFSCNDEALSNGGNMAILGNTPIQFAQATLIAERRYLLSGLVSDARNRAHRGRHSVTAHAGCRFVLVTGQLVRCAIDEVLLGKEFTYIATTSGQALSMGTKVKFTCEAKWWKMKGV